MTERSLIEQLDLAVAALLREERPTLADPELTALLSVAADLRRLPSEAFRAQLRSDLQRRAEMENRAEKRVKFREGFRTVTPYLAVRRAGELIDFVKEAFGAKELSRGTGSGAGLHAEVRIGDSMLMIGGGETMKGATLASLHYYVADVDAVYRRAVEAGAASMYPPTAMDYGDREAGVTDVGGNQWFIATHQATGHAPPGLPAVTPCVRAAGAPELITFLKRAFAAEELEVHKAPDGTIVHAKLRIGSSPVEVSEAHGQWQPLPSMFYLYVEDVDDGYQRALAAGAKSIQEPVDQPYGDRVGAVADAFGYTWYLGTPIKNRE